MYIPSGEGWLIVETEPPRQAANVGGALAEAHGIKGIRLTRTTEARGSRIFGTYRLSATKALNRGQWTHCFP